MDQEKKRDPKTEREAKVRCAAFLLQMVEKYGAEIIREKEMEEACGERDISTDRK